MSGKKRTAVVKPRSTVKPGTLTSRRVTVRPLQLSPVGVYTVTVKDRSRTDRRFWRDIQVAMKKHGVESGLLVPLFAGESIEALPREAAAGMYDSLCKLLGVGDPFREAAAKAVAAVDALPVSIYKGLSDGDREALNVVVEKVCGLRGERPERIARQTVDSVARLEGVLGEVRKTVERYATHWAVERGQVEMRDLSAEAAADVSTCPAGTKCHALGALLAMFGTTLPTREAL